MKILIIIFLIISLSSCSKSGGDSINSPTTPSTTIPTVNILEDVYNASILRNEIKLFSLNAESFDSYSLESSPTKGSISGTFPNISYTPNINSSGSDSFRFLITKGSIQKRLIFNISINAQNTAPVVSDAVFFVQKGNSIILSLQGQDSDNDILTYEIVQYPDTGLIRSINSSLGYDAPNTILTTFFYYKAYDGKEYSNIAKGTINVTRINQNPIITTASEFTLAEDNSLLINLSATDADGDSIIFNIKNQPLNGIISGSLPNIIYTPNSNYHGADSIVVEALDPIGGKSSKTISLVITPVADQPVLLDKNISVAYNDTVIVPLDVSDPDGDNLTYIIVQNPTKGFINVLNNKIIYTHNGYFGGSDSFQVKVSDGIMMSEIATVTIQIQALDLEPIADDLAIELPSNSVKNITLSGTTYSGSPVYSIVESPVYGLLSGTPPNVVYTPNNNITTDVSDRFAYKITENGKTSNIAIVNLSLKGNFNYFGFNGNEIIFSNTLSAAPDIINVDNLSVKSQSGNFVLGAESTELSCVMNNLDYVGIDISSRDSNVSLMNIDSEMFDCLNNIYVKKNGSESSNEKIYDLNNLIFIDKTVEGVRKIYLGYKGVVSIGTDIGSLSNGMSVQNINFQDKMVENKVVPETELFKTMDSGSYVRLPGENYNEKQQVPDSNPIAYIVTENLPIYAKLLTEDYGIVYPYKLMGIYYLKNGVMVEINDANYGISGLTNVGQLLINENIAIMKLNYQLRGFKDTYTNEDNETVFNVGNDYRELIKVMIIKPN